MNEIFLDTETTGLSSNDGDRILEIACIETKDLIPTKKIFHKLTHIFRSILVASLDVEKHKIISII